MCTSPFVRVPINDSSKVDLYYRKNIHNGAIIFGSQELLEYQRFIQLHTDKKSGAFIFDIQLIPCNQCLDCRIKRSQEWANRCVLEANQYKHNYFITLTYDDEHLITNTRYTVSRQTGELGYFADLNLEDFTKFKKRLIENIYRETGHRGVRFFMCGEYGSQFSRPHFHSLLFNCPLPDIKLHSKVNMKGFKYCYYTSEILSKSWDKGFVMIGEFCWETAAYVARYVTKKLHSGEEKEYQRFCALNEVEPLTAEFINMSRKPGIARAYYDNNKDKIYKNDNIVISNGRTSKPFRYYDNLFELEGDLNPFYLDTLKAERKRTAQLKHLAKYKGVAPDTAAALEKAAAKKRENSYSKLKRELV